MKTRNIPSLTDHRTKLGRLKIAVGLLPDLPRQIYLLSARDGYSHLAIAERFGLDFADVTRQLAMALIAIDQALHPDEGWSDEPDQYRRE